MNSCFRSQGNQDEILRQNHCAPRYGKVNCAGRIAANISEHTVGTAADFNIVNFRGTVADLCHKLDATGRQANGGRGGITVYGLHNGKSALHLDIKNDWCNWGLCEGVLGEGHCKRTKFRQKEAELEKKLAQERLKGSQENVKQLEGQLAGLRADCPPGEASCRDNFQPGSTISAPSENGSTVEATVENTPTVQSPEVANPTGGDPTGGDFGAGSLDQAANPADGTSQKSSMGKTLLVVGGLGVAAGAAAFVFGGKKGSKKSSGGSAVSPSSEKAALAALRLKSFPTSSKAGESIAFDVEIVNAAGSIVKSSSLSVTASCVDPDCGLEGNLSSAAEAGVAHFSGLTLTKAGSVKLNFKADGLPGLVSPVLKVE